MSRHGFSLLELIIAMAILLIGVIGVSVAIPSSLRASRQAEIAGQAAQVAKTQLERLKLVPYHQLIADDPGVPLSGTNGSFNWAASVRAVEALAGLPPSPEVRALQMTVTWDSQGQPTTATYVTYIAP